MKKPRAPTTRRARPGARTFVAVACVALLVSWNFMIRTQAYDGELDSSFGSGGKTVSAIFTGGYAIAHSIARQPDGKLVLAGAAFKSIGAASDFGVARFNTDGSPDTSFGANGKVTTQFLVAYDEAFAVAVQPDGKILIAGGSGNFSTSDVFALARYNSDGSLDSAFGDDGKVTTTFDGGSVVVANALLIQPDGKIVVAGTVEGVTGFHFALARYKENGKLDKSFGTAGRVTTHFDQFAKVFSALIQPDDKIVLAGLSLSNDTQEDFALVRYSPNGSLDATFGSGGKVITDFSGNHDQATAIALQPDGRIVAGGMSKSRGAGTGDFALARYNADGSLDTFFGTGGKVTTDMDHSDDAAFAVAIQHDGRIVAAGTEAVTDFNFALARYNTDGTLDESFGGSGKVITDFFGYTDEALALLILPDGRLVAAGFSAVSADVTYGFALACYQVEAILPIITGAEVSGKKLYVYGKNFDSSAEVFMNGEKQKKTFNDEATPTTMLVARKSGKKIASGETVTLQVRNNDGRMSNEFAFTRLTQ